jgi:hypothetical protein
MVSFNNTIPYTYRLFCMINLSILISSSEVISGPGGLFDFNATLPLVAIQFYY